MDVGDSRLKASVVVPFEDGPTSARMIEARAGDPDFAQVLLLSRTAEPIGQRRYWPIYQAAAEAELPVGIHAFGYGGTAITSGGWPSYYIEEMVGSCAVPAGGADQPDLGGRVRALPDAEGGAGRGRLRLVPALAWRLDRAWAKLRKEMPHLTRPPSEYLRAMSGSPRSRWRSRSRASIWAMRSNWIGMDRVLFATDYPHWDFDDPAHALPIGMTETQRRGIFLENAKAVYGIG